MAMGSLVVKFHFVYSYPQSVGTAFETKMKKK